MMVACIGTKKILEIILDGINATKAFPVNMLSHRGVRQIDVINSDMAITINILPQE